MNIVYSSGIMHRYGQEKVVFSTVLFYIFHTKKSPFMLCTGFSFGDFCLCLKLVTSHSKNGALGYENFILIQTTNYFSILSC